ncbi:glycosyltransferase family 2 protein [Crenothrix sp.]|uniref:glycosyltransferase family 2 protein n=1 Tax=Crenothrix sp. TaxID=3100433 RepID=UPI00374C9056
MEDDLISVIICTKNRPELLLEAVDSVLAQTWRNWELIIVDDGSSESVEPLVSRHLKSQQAKFSFVRHEHSQGIAVARNVGVGNASGRYLYFLDDDDLLINHSLQILLQTLQEFSLGCVFHNIRPFGKDAASKADELVKANSKVLSGISIKQPRKGVYVFEKDLFEGLLLSVPLSFQRFLVTRELWGISGGMRPAAKMPEPEWVVKVALLGKCGLLLESLGLWRVDGQNIFSLKEDEHKIQSRVIDNMHSLVEFAENSEQVNAQEMRIIKQALCKAYFSLAWQYLEQNQRICALSALYHSALIQIGFEHFKLLVKLGLPKLEKS